jgi:hypothetical protein
VAHCSKARARCFEQRDDRQADPTSGELQSFDERFEKLVGWQLRQKPGLSRSDAERDTLAFMAKMPAWKDHPRELAGTRGADG